MTFPPAEPEHSYARHTAERPHRDWGRAEPSAPWQPSPPSDAGPPLWRPESPAGPQAWPQPPGPAPGAHPRWASDAGSGWGAAAGATWFADHQQTISTGPGYSHDHRSQEYVLGHEPTGPTVWEQALPDLRNKIVNRLASMNWNQAVATWERRRRDPLNPHVLVFFFAEPPTSTPPRCELRVAARLFPAGDEQRLAMLLYELGPVIREHLWAGRNPDRYVFSWHDRRTRHARYAGLGVTTLDTPAGTWTEVQRVAQTDMDVPGRCYAHLTDGSMLLIDRLARQRFGEYLIWTSHPVRDLSGHRHRPTTYARDLASDRYGPDNQAIWQWLGKLHRVVAEVDGVVGGVDSGR